MSNKVLVIIPIYKLFLTDNELISLNQGIAVLKNHDIAFLLPEKFRNITGDCILKNKKYESYRRYYFNDCYFKSISGYNTLLLTLEFYITFKDYEYLLIYQTDAFVFNDELEKFCSLDYDYIGAPWFDGLVNVTEQSEMLDYAGNGGLSLRKVDSFINVLKNRECNVETFKDIVKRFDDCSTLFKISRIPRMIIDFFINNKVGTISKKVAFYEDYFFSKYGSKAYPDFNVAPPNIAYTFSFEVNPHILFKLNNNKLPFGCHGWWRYNPEFWMPIISHYKID